MKAAILLAPRQPMVLEDIAIGNPGPREILLRNRAAGVCQSDVSIADGKLNWRYPVVLGHECAGIVEAVGSDVTAVRPGDHVVICASAFCGSCPECLTGHMALCGKPGSRRPRGSAARLEAGGSGEAPAGQVHQFQELGGFAELMLVHERNCVAISRDMPFDRAALMGCSVVTGLGAVSHAAGVKIGDTVAVLGCGGVGLMAVNGAAIAGASRIIAIDRMPIKLEAARSMGATDIINASEVDAVEAVRELTGGGVHHAIEAIGLKTTIEQAFAMARRGGQAIVLGIPPLGTKIELDAFQFTEERGIKGSLMGSNRFPVDIPRYIELYMQGRLKLDELISGRLQLDQINSAFDEMRRGSGAARSVIEFPA